MKKIAGLGAAIFALSALSGAAFAATPGTYLGAGLGYNALENVYINPSAIPTGVSVKQQNGGLGGRAFGGYNFNQYFGIESGYEYFAQSNFSAINKSNLHTAGFSQRYQTVDLVGKAYLPISNSGFNLYALGGGAYVNDYMSGSGLVHGSESTNTVRPKYGVGVSYDIPESKWTTSLEFARIQGNHNVPSSNSVMLSISYNFD